MRDNTSNKTLRNDVKIWLKAGGSSGLPNINQDERKDIRLSFAKDRKLVSGEEIDMVTFIEKVQNLAEGRERTRWEFPEGRT